MPAQRSFYHGNRQREEVWLERSKVGDCWVVRTLEGQQQEFSNYLEAYREYNWLVEECIAK